MIMIFVSEGTLLRGEEIQYEQIKNEVDEILNDDFRKRLNSMYTKVGFAREIIRNLSVQMIIFVIFFKVSKPLLNVNKLQISFALFLIICSETSMSVTHIRDKIYVT